jgi:acyl-CoA synthetase (AMP-forming)/AMP-acid ligase II
LAPEELENFLGRKLARYKIPRRFVFVPTLPRTPYGKVVKGELRESFPRGEGRGAWGEGPGESVAGRRLPTEPAGNEGVQS